MDNLTKKCSKCKQSKFLYEFHVSSKYGRQGQCKDCRREYRQAPEQKARQKIYRENPENRAKEKARQRTWRETYKDILKPKKKAYKAAHRVRYKARNKRKRETDPQFRLDCNMGRAISKALKGVKNHRTWKILVPYTLIELKAHLESLFLPGMTWENHGIHGWHIDHIIPKSHFDYICPEDPEFKECWALNNLQPL